MCDPLRVLQGKALAARRYERCCLFCAKPFSGKNTQKYCTYECCRIAKSLKGKAARAALGKPKYDPVEAGKRLSSIKTAKICAICDKPFLGRNRQTNCSRDCLDIARSRKSKADRAAAAVGRPKTVRKKSEFIRVEKPCYFCEKPFLATLKEKYCSKFCYRKAGDKQKNAKRVKLTPEERLDFNRIFDVVCGYCKVTFVGMAHQKFCSLKCRAESKKLVKVYVSTPCAYCSTPFEKDVSTRKKYCSARCNRLTFESKFIKRDLACLNCHTPFKLEGRKSQRRKFCSVDCRRNMANQNSYFLKYPEEQMALLQGKLSEALSEPASDETKP
jgi:hypothetical protein